MRTFCTSSTREEYLAYLSDGADRDIAYDPESIGRYNVAPGTKVLLLSERDEQLHLDPVLWSYARGWWDQAPLINACVETAAIGSTPFESGNEDEGSMTVTVVAGKGLVYIL